MMMTTMILGLFKVMMTMTIMTILVLCLKHAKLSFTTTFWHQVSSDNDYNDYNHCNDENDENDEKGENDENDENVETSM